MNWRNLGLLLVDEMSLPMGIDANLGSGPPTKEGLGVGRRGKAKTLIA
jgi:hypothetical protein